MRHAVIVIALLLLAVPAAQARPSQVSIIESPRETRSDDPGARAAALDDAQSLGADYIRINLFWRDVAPDASSATRPAFDETDPNAYAWTSYDRLVDEATARGLKVFFTVTAPGPRWAMRDKKDQVTRPVPARFRAFVTAAGRHFPSVHLWSVFNEPNHPLFLKPQYVKGKPASPAIYRSLYLAAKKGFSASGHGGDTILAGETAPFQTRGLVSPLAMLRGTLKGKKIGVDGWATHPYTGTQGPDYVSSNPDNVTIGSLGRLSNALNKAGYRRTPIWITEFGVQSEPDPNGVDQITQNRFRNESERIAFRNPRVRSFAQYLIRDDLKRSGSDKFGGFESGLRFAGGKAKLAFDGYRLPLTVDRAGSKVKFWGLVRPADGRTVAMLEVQGKGGWKPLKRVQTDGNGAFTAKAPYKAGLAYRLNWDDLTGPPTRAA